MNPSAHPSFPSPPSPISRTTSLASFTSIDDESTMSSTAVTISTSRRTRKRFTNAQLSMLESLFHQNHHPSREDREAVAKAGAMEIKSVTIWFQNKRQTERKTAATLTALHSSSNATSNAIPNITSTIHTFSLHNDSQNASRTASPPFSVSCRTSATPTSTTSLPRPSLDHVASRSELRASSTPRTPSRRQNSSGAIWDNMPSSPIASPLSPPAQDYIEWGSKNPRTRMTLEYVCAARRAADKEKDRETYTSSSRMPTSYTGSNSNSNHQGYNSSVHGSSRADGSSRILPSIFLRDSRRGDSYTSQGRDYRRTSHSPDADLTEEEEEEEDDDEAITPPSTWGKDDQRWTTTANGAHTTRPNTNLMSSADGRRIQPSAATAGSELPKSLVEDDAMFKAALALCGLGRRT